MMTILLMGAFWLLIAGALFGAAAGVNRMHKRKPTLKQPPRDEEPPGTK